uniref:NADH-ubiquinone oxidoreductase chain 2 n=1 Tax=Scotoplanes sp. TT-2017 TaxID=1979181 RepID=A0A3G9GQM0_9ECHN|nr:NADH dehydrogenase subunit 2 [Scotoplanes sp. TT-2017]
MNRYIQIFLITNLMLGTFIVIFSTHWFSIWIGLELSTLAILPLLTSNQISRSNEATLKYFLVQAFSATLLLNGVLMNVWLTNNWNINLTNNPLPNFLILFSLITKLGLAPCHFWFPDVLSGLSFLNGLIISCWQKIAPLYLIITINSSFPNELILISGILSVLIGGWNGLNQTSIRKILAFSSISHLGWIISISFFNNNISLILFFLYIIITSLVFLLSYIMNTKSLSNLNNLTLSPNLIFLYIINILSLGGLPPLGGFINKIIPIYIFTNNFNYLFLLPFLIGSLLSLFFYLRIAFNTNLILFPQHSLSYLNWNTNFPSNFNYFISLLTSISLLSLILLPLFFSFI